MQRRLFLSDLTCLSLAGVTLGLGACASVAPRRVVLTTAQLQAMAGKRFPLRHTVANFFEVLVQAPVLQMLPAQNRLNAVFALEVSSAAVDRKQTGTLELDFALRYEPSDRTLRATRLQFKRLDFANVSPNVLGLVRQYGQALSERALLEVVIHQLQPKDLAGVEGLGLQPGSITVTDAGLEMVLVGKP